MATQSKWIIGCCAVCSVFCVLTVSTSGAPPQASSSNQWIPYSAQYVESSSWRNSSGSETTQNVGEEIRSSAGSLLTIETVDGNKVSGKLWDSCGRVILLNYQRKEATVRPTVTLRRHLHVPPTAPIGSKMIAGVECAEYPAHIDNGTSTVWIDLNDDILVRSEFHVDTNGTHHDYIRELKSIDFSTPVNLSAMQIPTGFTTLSSPATPLTGCTAQ